MGNGKAFYLGGHYDEVKNCTFHDNGELGFDFSFNCYRSICKRMAKQQPCIKL